MWQPGRTMTDASAKRGPRSTSRWHTSQLPYKEWRDRCLVRSGNEFEQAPLGGNRCENSLNFRSPVVQDHDAVVLINLWTLNRRHLGSLNRTRSQLNHHQAHPFRLAEEAIDSTFESVWGRQPSYIPHHCAYLLNFAFNAHALGRTRWCPLMLPSDSWERSCSGTPFVEACVKRFQHSRKPQLPTFYTLGEYICDCLILLSY